MSRSCTRSPATTPGRCPPESGSAKCCRPINRVDADTRHLSVRERVFRHRHRRADRDPAGTRQIRRWRPNRAIAGLNRRLRSVASDRGRAGASVGGVKLHAISNENTSPRKAPSVVVVSVLQTLIPFTVVSFVKLAVVSPPVVTANVPVAVATFELTSADGGPRRVTARPRTGLRTPRSPSRCLRAPG